MRRLPALLFLLAALSAPLAVTAETGSSAEPLTGRRVVDVLEDYLDLGYELLFSTSLVSPDLVIESEPAGITPIERLRSVLIAHDLDLKAVGSRYVVVKRPAAQPEKQAPLLLVDIRNLARSGESWNLAVKVDPPVGPPEELAPGLLAYSSVPEGEYTVTVEIAGHEPGVSTVRLEAGKTRVVTFDVGNLPRKIEQVTVTASRYVLLDHSRFVIDQKAIKGLPNTSSDAVRSVQRLQGAATTGFTSLAHIRGGLLNETGIYLNGAQLLAPFHVANYHSLFSLIDTHAVSSIEVYTGGFPTRYGNNVSGIVQIETKPASEDMHTELGLSTFYTSILNSGTAGSGRTEWLVSARRSNLDAVVNDSLGEPHWRDLFINAAYNLDSGARISLNALYSDDDVTVFKDSDPDQPENSRGISTNNALWLTAQKDWGGDWTSETVGFAYRLAQRRMVISHDPSEMIADVTDRRHTERFGLRQTFTGGGWGRHYLTLGGEIDRQNTDYDYAASAEYFGIFALYPGFDQPVFRFADRRVEADAYALFAADRLALTPEASLELGLRWDRQKIAQQRFADQWSPRLSFTHSIGQHSSLQLAAGRYYQQQGAHELQIGDGIDEFWQPQRADHYIAAYQWAPVERLRFRAEAYYKDYGRISPRFENLFDPLELAPELRPDRIRLDPASARASGLELGIEYNNGENLNWWGSYTLSRVTDRILEADERRNWDQLHSIQFGLRWQQFPWEVSAAIIAHTGWPRTKLRLEFDADTDTYLPVPGPRNAGRHNPFVSLDFRIERQFEIARGRLTSFLEVSNATNRNNTCCVDYEIEVDEDGASRLIEQTDSWFPIFGNIGVIWEF